MQSTLATIVLVGAATAAAFAIAGYAVKATRALVALHKLIKHELEPNHGTSLVDSVQRIEVHNRHTTIRLSRLERAAGLEPLPEGVPLWEQLPPPPSGPLYPHSGRWPSSPSSTGRSDGN